MPVQFFLQRNEELQDILRQVVIKIKLGNYQFWVIVQTR